MVVPFPPGGGSDQYSRTVAAKMAKDLGTQLQVRNVDGAASLLGLRQAMSEPGDGYTLTTFNPPSSPIAQIAAGENAGVDLRKATMIGGWGSSSYVVFAHPSVKADSLEDVIKLYKSGELRALGGQEQGGPVELLAHMVKDRYDWQWKDYVAYDGGGEVEAAVLRNEVPVAITTDATIIEQVRSGKLKAIAALTDERSKSLPDVPTAVEQKYESVAAVGGITRLVAAPPNLPEDIRKKLTKALEDAIKSKEIQDWSKKSGNPVDFIDAEQAKKVVDDAFTIEEQVPGLKEIIGAKP